MFKAAKLVPKAKAPEIVEVDMPSSSMWCPCITFSARAEASSNLGRYDGIRFGYRALALHRYRRYDCYDEKRGLRQGSTERILLGTYVLSSGYFDAYYKKA